MNICWTNNLEAKTQKHRLRVAHKFTCLNTWCISQISYRRGILTKLNIRLNSWHIMNFFRNYSKIRTLSPYVSQTPVYDLVYGWSLDDCKCRWLCFIFGGWLFESSKALSVMHSGRARLDWPKRGIVALQRPRVAFLHLFSYTFNFVLSHHKRLLDSCTCPD